MLDRIGVMQGRLSPLIKGRVQAFPWDSWQEEFAIADRLGLGLIEWTLDQERLHENPLLSAAGQAEIGVLRREYGIDVPSLTGDCFMQAPFWKVRGEESQSRRRDFRAVAEACVDVGVSIIVVPLVDKGRIEKPEQAQVLLRFLEEQSPFLLETGLRVLFECDFGPAELARFISAFDPDLFGINYDIGNSAAAGFDPVEEIEAYGHRISSVHVKDRVRGGATVPLGSGAADFEAVFAALGRVRYRGNYILQAARATDGDHAGVVSLYRNMTAEWMTSHGI